MELVEIGLIDLNGATAVDHPRDECVRFALVFGGRPALAIAEKIVVALTSLVLRLSAGPPHISVVACRVVSIP